MADLGNLPRDTGSCARPEAIAANAASKIAAHAASTKYLRFADRGGDAMVRTVPEEIAAAVPEDGAGAWMPRLPADAAIRSELESLCSRFRSERISAADWQRKSRSFSRALLMIRSSSAGKSGFKRAAGAGVRFKMESKISAVVSPRKGIWPVAIS